MEKVKIFVVGGDKIYAQWIDNHILVDMPEKADIVLFTGGEDVDPSIYSCEIHPTTYSNLARDTVEQNIFDQVDPNKQICVGICRGSQFLCAMNGGILVQNCDGHALVRTHTISNGIKDYEITSTHHQMQYPFKLNKKDYDILYWSDRLSSYYEGDKVGDVPKEPEVVLYHADNKPLCLAIQGHPEYMRKESPIISKLNKIITKCLEEKLQNS